MVKMDGCTNKRMRDGWMWCMYAWMDKLIDGWMDERMNGWMDGWMEGWMDGGMDGWING